MSDNLEVFREEVSAWVTENFPRRLVGSVMGLEGQASDEVKADFELWRQRLAGQGWGAQTCPKDYGGAELSDAEA
mgnify:CR=1 FL=1